MQQQNTDFDGKSIFAELLDLLCHCPLTPSSQSNIARNTKTYHYIFNLKANLS